MLHNMLLDIGKNQDVSDVRGVRSGPIGNEGLGLEGVEEQMNGLWERLHWL